MNQPLEQTGMPVEFDTLAPQQNLNTDNSIYPAAQPSVEAGEQNQQEIGFNPFLMQMFLRAHGNKEMSHQIAGLMVTDVAIKQVVRYHQQYDSQASELAHLEQMNRQQVSATMPTEDNVLFPSFGAKRKNDNRRKQLIAA